MKAAGATAEVQATYPSSAVTTLPTMVATSAMAPFPVSPHASVCGGGGDGVCVCGSVCVWGGGVRSCWPWLRCAAQAIPAGEESLAEAEMNVPSRRAR